MAGFRKFSTSCFNSDLERKQNLSMFGNQVSHMNKKFIQALDVYTSIYKMRILFNHLGVTPMRTEPCGLPIYKIVIQITL